MQKWDTGGQSIMKRRSVRVGSRALVLVGAMSLMAAVPNLAQAKTEYDGEATALSISGLKLTLFPADAKLPEMLAGIPRPPEQVIELSGSQLGLPSTVGHATFPGVDEPGSLPDNPLLNGGGLKASSARVGERVVSEAKIGYLDIGGGAVTLDDIVATCTGNGQQISLDAPLAAMGGQLPFGGELELEPNTATPIPGIGSITWNDQVSDGATYGQVSNLVLDLKTNLDADVLQDLPEAMAAFEGVVQDLLGDLKKAGEASTGLEIPLDPATLSGQPLYDLLDDVVSQLPTAELPDLNALLRLEGTITLASAACSQKSVTVPIDHNPPPNEDENPPPAENPPNGGENNEPPLADTGVSPWPLRAGVAGMLAIAAGGFLVLRQRRNQV
jgi:hypothetical protein